MLPFKFPQKSLDSGTGFVYNQKYSLQNVYFKTNIFIK